MARQGAASSMRWLGPLLADEPDALDVLPASCLCELLTYANRQSALTINLGTGIGFLVMTNQ